MEYVVSYVVVDIGAVFLESRLDGAHSLLISSLCSLLYNTDDLVVVPSAAQLLHGFLETKSGNAPLMASVMR